MVYELLEMKSFLGGPKHSLVVEPGDFRLGIAFRFAREIDGPAEGDFHVGGLLGKDWLFWATQKEKKERDNVIINK